MLNIVSCKTQTVKIVMNYLNERGQPHFSFLAVFYMLTTALRLPLDEPCRNISTCAIVILAYFEFARGKFTAGPERRD